MLRGNVAIFVVAAALSCGQAPAHTPDSGPRRGPDVGPASPAPVDAGPSVEHVVAEGETLWDIARAYHVTVDAIMERNRLRPHDVRRLSKGTRLRVPGATVVVDIAAQQAAAQPETLPEITDGAYHRLADGETLWDLARRYDVTVDAIMERNQWSEDDARNARPGRAVIIPGIRASQIRERPPAERERVVHTMAEGETIWDLAASFGVSVAEIMSANGLSTAEVTQLRAGTRLGIPGVSQDRRGRVRRNLTGAQLRAAQIARRLGLGTRQAAGELLHGRVRPEWIRAAGGGRRAELPGTLRWPVSQGWYVRGWGSGEGGYHLAMDIMGEIGWNVRSSARGIVGYAGDEIPGFGNIVQVIHPGGWVTMYAHNSSNYVVAGQTVPAGGILAEVGSTGISRGPHVHFELIWEGKNCDPAPLFRPAVRHRNGRRALVRALTWRMADDRPEGIRCSPRRRHPRSRWVIHEDPVADAAPESEGH